MTATLNGKPPRKQLSDQIDRMDGIIDVLADALPQAVGRPARRPLTIVRWGASWTAGRPVERPRACQPVRKKARSPPPVSPPDAIRRVHRPMSKTVSLDE